MATGDLVTLAQALPWLGQTVDENGIIAMLVSAVSTKIQAFVGYQFAAASYTRTFNGFGGVKLLLPDRPVNAVDSLTVDGVVIPASAGPFVPGFTWDSKFVYVRGYRLHRGVQNITITYEAGYAAVPADVQQACLEWLTVGYGVVFGDTDPAAKSVRAGDTQIDYGNVVTRVDGATILMPPSVAAALSVYQRTAT